MIASKILFLSVAHWTAFIQKKKKKNELKLRKQCEKGSFKNVRLLIFLFHSNTYFNFHLKETVTMSIFTVYVLIICH